jgi:nitrate/nitrite-specific signal transduction histidine kinase
MRERAVAICADLALETSPGHGTSVRVRVRVPA